MNGLVRTYFGRSFKVPPTDDLGLFQSMRGVAPGDAPPHPLAQLGAGQQHLEMCDLRCFGAQVLVLQSKRFDLLPHRTGEVVLGFCLDEQPLISGSSTEETPAA